MIILLFSIVLISLYFYMTKTFNYWSKRKVKHDPPIPFFGNHFRNVCGIKSITELSVELYNKHPEEKVVGYFRGSTPELIIRDTEIARHILNVDFVHFYPRGVGRDPKTEPLFLNLFHTEGDSWKLLRQRLTSAFTSAKLKAMFPLIINCANKLHVIGEKIVANGGECDIRDVMARFTTEFIGACGFGIEMDTINNEKSMFRELGRWIFNRPWTALISIGLWEVFPPILRPLLPTKNNKLEDTITSIVKGIREQRNFKPSGRNDFIDLMLELEAKGKLFGESIEKKDPSGKPLMVEMDFDLKCFIAQVFVFFAAGFETSSSATSYLLHELAFHQEIQRKIQEEIDKVLSKYDNKLCYDAISEMNLLDMAFKESMRLFPSLGNLNRVCVKRYTIPDTDIIIDPGVKITIPIQAIQTDENYFDNPKEFRPERFTPDAVKNQNKYCYLPFGAGPRACIGERLGHMQSLAGLAAILQKFNVEPSASTRRQLKVSTWANVIQGVQGGLPLKITLRKSKSN